MARDCPIECPTDGENMRHLKRRKSGIWMYRRRVPTDVAHIDRRGTVERSCKTRSAAKAAIVAERINAETEAYWEGLLQGAPTLPSAKAFEEAVIRARGLGFTYVPPSEFDTLSDEAVLCRVEALERANLLDSRPAIEAVLGGPERPSLMISEVFETFEGLVRHSLSAKAPDQVRKWRNPRLKSIANLLSVIGDMPVQSITRDHALDFRAWWDARLQDEGLTPGSANKDIGHLNRMLTEIDRKMRLGIDAPFAALRFAGAEDSRRVPFETDQVRRILRSLDGLNEQAATVVRVMSCTGLRPSEIVSLTPEAIHLQHNVPHVQIRAIGREIKTKNALRDMPLCGTALEAMRDHPEGLPRYRGHADALSASVNKFMLENGLRPTPDHTLYSLRHSFQDRLIAAEVPERIQADLMGHRLDRTKYGLGASLEQKAKWLELVAV